MVRGSGAHRNLDEERNSRFDRGKAIDFRPALN